MSLSATIIATFVAIFSFLTIVLNYGLLYSIFVSKKLRRSFNLSLFYVRFGIDGLIGVTNVLTIAFAFVEIFSPGLNLDSYQIVIFIVGWLNSNFTGIRSILVNIITLDRVFAVILPISYHKSRKKIPNFLLIFIACCYPILNHFILWEFCDFNPNNFLSGCTSFGCLLPICYQRFGLGFDLGAHSVDALTSSVLATNIFLWNRCKNSAKSKELERANHLAFIDTFIIILFDIIPSALVFLFPISLVVRIGSFYVLARMGGYALEAILVRRALYRKNDNKSSVVIIGNTSELGTNFNK